MSTQEQKQIPESAKKQTWNQISSDQDDSVSQKSDEDQKPAQSIQKQSSKPQQEVQEKPKKQSRQPRIKAFDPKKHMRVAPAGMKTVKGGFKAQKLEKKKFQLHAAKNPFAFGQESEQQQQQAEKPVEDSESKEVQPTQQTKEKLPQQSKKLSKKQKKKKQMQELEAALAEFGVKPEQPANQQGKKKKKKKNKNKDNENKQGQAQQKPQQGQNQNTENQVVQDFEVDKAKIQQALKKRAQKGGPKKKNTGLDAAKKAAQQRDQKNKVKKTQLDL